MYFKDCKEEKLSFEKGYKVKEAKHNSKQYLCCVKNFNGKLSSG